MEATNCHFFVLLISSEKKKRKAGERMIVYSYCNVSDNMNLFHGHSVRLNVTINGSNYDMLFISQIKIKNLAHCCIIRGIKHYLPLH